MAADQDDRALVERICRSRDERAFTLLYERHATRLYRLAPRLTAGDEFSAEDIVHDAWLAAVPRLKRFEWRSQFSSWLAGFVVNIARARNRRAPEEPLDVVSGEDDRELLGAIDRVDLERALAELTHDYREILVLHDAEGFTHEEIAGLLGITAGGSKSRLSRARAAVRSLLPQGGVNEEGSKRHV